MNAWRRAYTWWVDRGAWVMAAAFLIATFALMVRQHDAFHTRALDLGKFDQAIWNTLHGRFLTSTLQGFSILGNHFSPFMALLSPLFLIWPNVRALFLVQTVGLAAAGLLLDRIVRRTRPGLATWFAVAFFLNPALHEVALDEFRRVTLAVPFLALALYGLSTRKRPLTALGLGLALLCKEDIALIVVMVGLYLLIFERDARWGWPLAALGLAWALVVTLWVIPAFRPPGDSTSLYPQLNYFGLSGDTYQEILGQAMRRPWVFAYRMFDLEGRKAIWRVLFPVGLVLPFLAPDWLLIIVPSVSYMLMSSMPGMHSLQDWYMASVLPGLFAAVAVALTRLPQRWARWGTSGLVGCALASYLWFSHGLLGGQYAPELYRVAAHQRLAAQAVAAVPREARVATQDPYVPHLSHREHIYLYPWISIGPEQIDFFLLDRHLHPYPLQRHEMDAQIDDMIADTRYTIEWEADGIYLFHQRGQPLPSFSVDAVADGTMHLERVEVATSDQDGVYRTVAQAPAVMAPGQLVRVSLYWEALVAPDAERTISVRVTDGSGSVVAIYDNLPGQGKKPTSWWEQGWQIRDVYYLTVSPQAQAGRGSLSLLVYDSVSGETAPFEDGTEILELCEVVIGP
jgi:uncharacterized membrane protein